MLHTYLALVPRPVELSPAMSASGDTREYLGVQLYELEALQSVYPKELTIVDHGTLADINEFVAGEREDPPQRLEYSIAIAVPEGSVELQINLPLDYPERSPEVYVSSQLDRTQQNRLNEALIKFAEAQEPGEPCIYSLVTWLQDNLEGYFRDSKRNAERENSLNSRKKEEEPKDTIFSRYWVYSHHIYSNLKRKDIVEEAKENSLSGFCLPGKPGIICIEGAMDDCEYWWQKIKVMNWHRIFVKLREDEELCDQDCDSFRKFTGFQEISFPSSDKHNDMGQLLKFLTEHESQHVFKELFGVEGKSALPA